MPVAGSTVISMPASANYLCVDGQDDAVASERHASRIQPERALRGVAEIAEQRADAGRPIDLEERASLAGARVGIHDQDDAEPPSRDTRRLAADRPMCRVAEIAQQRAHAGRRIDSEQRAQRIGTGLRIDHRESRPAESEAHRSGRRRSGPARRCRSR